MAMNCPQCAGTLQRRALEAGSAYVCGNCGWGRDPDDAWRGSQTSRGEDKLKVSAKTWIKLPIFWVLTFIICLGPYLALIHGLPSLFQQQGWDFANLTPEAMREKINPGYWIALLVYVALAGTVNIGVDFENLGLFGTMRDNPFSYEDDRNRLLLKIGVFLFPGRIVAFTLIGTFRILLFLVGIGRDG
jgi:hypothetical protein